MIVPTLPKHLEMCQWHPLSLQHIDSFGRFLCSGCQLDEDPTAERECACCDQQGVHIATGPFFEYGPGLEGGWILLCDQCHDDLTHNRLQVLVERFIEHSLQKSELKSLRTKTRREIRQAVGGLIESYQRGAGAIRWVDLSVDYAARIQSLIAEEQPELANARVVIWREDLWEAATRGNTAFHRSDWNLATLYDQVWLIQSREPIFIHHQETRAFGPTPRRLVGYLLHRKLDKVYPAWLVEQATHRFGSGIVHEVQCIQPSRQDRREWYGFSIGEPIPDWFCPLAAAAAFMDMRFVVAKRAYPSRHLRRQLGKAGKPEPEIQVITLRRSGSEQHGEGLNEGREWSCSWMVSGHWRRQWMPRKRIWEPRYIRPYVKGDTNKPLKRPKTTVYVVRR